MYIQQFNFENRPIRVIQGKIERRMSAVDVCQALEYSEPRKAWNKLKNRNPELQEISIVVKLVTVEQNIEKKRDTDVLNLKGVIKLCMLAKTDKAVQFREWAANILVDNITANISDENYLEHIEKLLIIAKTEKAKRIQAENNLNEIKPDYDLWLSDKSAYSIADAARKINKNNPSIKKIGQEKLFAILRQEKIFFYEGKYNIPYQKYIDKGYFVVKHGTYKKEKMINGVKETIKIEGSSQSRITTKGMKWLGKFLEKKGYLK